MSSPAFITRAAGEFTAAQDVSRILLVDDIRENLTALGALLERDGVELHCALSGSEALELLLVHDFALAILDVQMPEMNGFELATLMRGAERTRAIPIIFLTANGNNQQHRFKGYESGAVDYLFKPIEPDILRFKVSVFLELYKSRQKVAQQRDELSAALDALHETHERLHFALESMPQKVFTAETQGQVLYLNQQWLEYTGAPEPALAGEGWIRFTHPEERAAHAERWRHCIQSGSPFELEHRIARHDGSYCWHLTRARGMRDEGGRIVTWIGSSTDIDSQKKTEQELRVVNEDLSYFAYAASHDLQEPLRMVNIFADMLVRFCGPAAGPKAQIYAQYIKEGTARMGNLLRDLLAYTRITKGEDRPATQVTDLGVAWQTAVQNLTAMVEENGAIIEASWLPSVRAHESHFVQLFQNLLSNALKYRSNAPPRVVISAQETRTGCTLSVRDNGIGIAPEFHDQIFGVFKRLHGKNIPGTGIGLAICQRVVQRYGGKLRVESRPGEGATFFIDLPAELLCPE
jgi:PAS domain S-box-containing protein